ncbi:hypothetical protein GWI33_013418 [Rhynchophorus ferrugineus]|uniref:Translation initiation factor eIF2B subunit gamma n=1 Tax=Rhynchophorus ferrugineus TaxID=354439 RepID=A0A834M9Z5_RHYFE|nr:hypothetical protein GWI33_013418 [Rhynchophorus ferrugineus]
MTVQCEFQAVVLAAGKGSRMLEFTAGKPKCLLPVGSKPLIWYILNSLQKSGFTEAIMIVLEDQKTEIQSAIENEIGNNTLNIKIEYVSFDDKEDLGTADSLRLKEVQEKIKSDVLVVSCDLITDVNFVDVLNTFRKHNASMTSLLFPSSNIEPVVVPGPRSKHKPEKDLIGIDERTSRLVFSASASDFEEEVSLPMSLLKKHQHIKLYSTLCDSHVYVLKNWVMQYLKSEDNFMSLKGELIPYIVKKQLSKPIKPADTNVSTVNDKDVCDIFSFAKEDQLSLDIREASAYNDHKGDLKPTYNEDPIRCYAYLAPKGCIGIRINTLPAYWSTNGKIQDIWDKVSGDQKLIKHSVNADIKSNQVDDKCVIWDGAKLSEKTSFKNTLIGMNASVNSFSRVFNSIIMNNVVIKEKVAIENSIISDNAVIESGSKIKNCIIGNHYLISQDSEHANEILTKALMHF